MQKTNCFFLNLEELYPTFQKQNQKYFHKWQELLTPFSVDDIIFAIKKYKRANKTTTPPTLEEFKKYLTHTKSIKQIKKTYLPFSPENYLMEQDLKAKRCKYLYPTYCKAVRYILNVRLKQHHTKEEYKALNFSARYISAVEKGLFADFDKVLDFVHKSGEYYD